MEKSLNPHQVAAYQIRVEGKLGESWLGGLKGVAAAFDGKVTTLSAAALDQAALRGLLCWLWDLNLVVLSINRLDLTPKGEGGM